MRSKFFYLEKNISIFVFSFLGTRDVVARKQHRLEARLQKTEVDNSLSTFSFLESFPFRRIKDSFNPSTDVLPNFSQFFITAFNNPSQSSIWFFSKNNSVGIGCSNGILQINVFKI